MTDDDQKLILVRLTQLAEVFNRTLTREVWHAYTKALDDLPGQTVLRALDRALRTCKRFPTPADIRELTRPDGNVPPRRALPAPSDGPPVTRASMARILREVAARDARGDFSPHGESGRVAWMGALADEMDGIAPPGSRGGLFGRVFSAIARRATEREPGEDDGEEDAGA